MKRGLIIAVVMVAVLATATMSFAWGRGGGGYGPGYWLAQLTPEQAQKVAAFQQAIQPEQQKMLQLRSELWTLRSQPNPDWNAISAKQREMFELRQTIQKQAVDSGVAGFGCGFGPRGKGMGRFAAW